MNTMSHRGYTARIEFDERDNIFVGRVLGLHTMISFHGETVAELRSEFETAIEEFLRDCKEQGVRPEKPASGKLMLRVPPEVQEASNPSIERAVQRAAPASRRSRQTLDSLLPHTSFGRLQQKGAVLCSLGRFAP